jgi:ABC-type phosphate transport system substrate-binding protein
VDFLTWMLDQGQTMSAQLDYAPLPDSVKEKEREAVKTIH